MSDLYFAKVPFRNTFLRLCNFLSPGSDLTRLLRKYEIDFVLDVGANKGQYGRSLIKSGFRGRIISFEPLPSAFEKLKLNRWGFSNWQIEPFALGGEYQRATFNIAANSQSSSLQPMLQSHIDAAPGAAYVDTCEVQVQRLDDVFDRYYQRGERCYMKLDVQGHEHEVIAGAQASLENITAVQMELSIRPLYAGAQTWQQAIEMMQDYGYELMLIQPGFCDSRTGQMLQADGIFVRRPAVQALANAA